MNNITKKVSVIIPTYKRSDMLTRAVDSVLAQTYKNIEVLVVDDNNPDTEYREITENVMSKYESDERVIYIKHEMNKNGAAARNTGFKNSTGDYIAFLDDDDIFLPNKIEKQVDYLEKHPEYDSVFCARKQNNLIVYKDIAGDLSKELLLDVFTPMTSSLLFRREAIENIGGFDESFRRHQDYELMLKFFNHKYQMGAIRDVLLEIGINEGENQLHGKELMQTKVRFLEIFNQQILQIEKKNPGFKRKVHSVHCLAGFIDYLKLHNYKRAFQMYIRGTFLSGVYFNYRLFTHFFDYIRIHIMRRIS